MSKLLLSSEIVLSDNIKFHLSGSKSISSRALIIHYLKSSSVNINNLSNSQDVIVLNNALCSKHTIIDIKQSGTAMRFLLVLFALENRIITLTGDEYLFQRPILKLIETLNSMGANICKKDNKIIINKGNISGRELNLKSVQTSQFISALLLVGPYIKNGIKLNFESNISSRPYINMTTSLMIQCGANLDITDTSIEVSKGIYKDNIYIIESDWTSASYLFVAFLFSDFKKIEIKYLYKNSLQGDIVIMDFFSLFGIKFIFQNDILILKKTNKHIIPNKIEWSFHNTPDIFPSILIACYGLGVECLATGIQNLIYKESNRILSLQKELSKLGCVIEMKSKDSILMKPNKFKKNKLICIDTYNDHRIALAFSTLALLSFKL